MGTCLICNKPLGTSEGECHPEERCWVKEGRSEFSVSLESAEKFGVFKTEAEYRNRLTPLLVAVLNLETAPDNENARKNVLQAAIDFFAKDQEANTFRAWRKTT
jgi:hypothetical protein